MATDTYDPYLDEDDPDEVYSTSADPDAHYSYDGPRPRHGDDRRRPDRRGADGEFLEEERSSRPGARVAAGVAIVGAGVASLVWVFAGPVTLLVSGGTVVGVWAGAKLIARRRRNDRRDGGRGREARRARRRDRKDRAAARRAERKKNRPGLADMFGGGKKAAAARRANLLGGGGPGGGRKPGGGLASKLAGLGKKRGGAGGAGRPGSKLGAGGGRGRGGKGPGSSGKGGLGGMLGRLKPKGKGKLGAAGSGGMGPKSRRGGKHAPGPGGKGPAAGPRLRDRLKPTAKGRAARAAHHQAKAAGHAAKQKARQARRDNRTHRAAKGTARAAYQQARAQAKQARFNNRRLKQKNRRVRNRYRRLHPGVWRRTARDFNNGLLFFARLGGRGIKLGVVKPVKFAHDRLFVRPGNEVTAWWGKIRAGRRRARMLRRRYKAIFIRPVIRQWRKDTWKALVDWVTADWMRKLAASYRKRGPWIAALAALVLAFYGMFSAMRGLWRFLARLAKAVKPKPKPQPQPQPRPAHAGPQPKPRPRPRPQAQPGPAAAGPVPNPWFPPNPGQDPATRPDPAQPAPGWAPSTAEGAVPVAQLLDSPTVGLTDDLEIPPGLHPVFGGLCEDARILQGMFDPQSVPDLAIFLNSLGTCLRAERDKWAAKGDDLAARFPGFNLAQEFAGAVAAGYSELARRSDDVFQQYRDAEEATFARFLEPRINEQWADVRRWNMSPVDPQRLTDGSMMHGSHHLWLLSMSSNFDPWFPDNGQNDDYVIELTWWLKSLAPFFTARARYAKNFTRNLAHGFPAEGDIASIVIGIARGYAELADYGAQLAAGYENRNPYDRDRRLQPKVNEDKRDVGNTQMTNAGAA